MVEILYRFLWQCVWFYNSICSGLIIYGPILYCIVTVCRTYCNVLCMQYMKMQHITGQSINTVYIV